MENETADKGGRPYYSCLHFGTFGGQFYISHLLSLASVQGVGYDNYRVLLGEVSSSQTLKDDLGFRLTDQSMPESRATSARLGNGAGRNGSFQ